MPTLAGWLTGEQVPQETIDQALLAMSEVLGPHGGEPGRMVQPGMGLITFTDAAYSMQRSDEPPVLDWVPDRRTLVYRRPLSGMHALYYISDWPAQGNLLFASEIKALFAIGVPRRLHLGALDALARYGFIPAPCTAFKDIFVVPAGSILRWQRGHTILNHATDYHPDEPLPPGDIADRLYNLLSEASAGMLPAHDQFIALSGGGSASALSTALAARQSSTPFTIASIGYKKYNSTQIWREAERIAAACQRPFLAITGVDQPEFWAAVITGLEAPVVDTRALAFHQLLHTASIETGARVAMSSLGARILLDAATQWPEAEMVNAQEAAELLRRYAGMLQQRGNNEIAALWSQDAASRMQQEEPWEQSLHARKLARNAARFAGRRRGWYYLDLHLRLPDHAVSAAQQLATQERIALRSPYLHADVIDMLTRLPSVLDDGTPEHELLSLLARRDIPTIAPSFPPALAAPARSLTRLADSELLRQMLSPEALRARGIFDTRAVASLLQRRQNAATQRALLLVFTTQLLCHLFDASI